MKYEELRGLESQLNKYLLTCKDAAKSNAIEYALKIVSDELNNRDLEKEAHNQNLKRVNTMLNWQVYEAV